jgi:phospholipid/cholesterol/gamma-HCH transport system ATP-binding protein
VNLKETLGVTSIVVTHNIKSAYKIADRIMMLYRGKVIFNGTPEETMRTENKYVRQFIEGSSYGPVISDEIFEAVKI